MATAPPQPGSIEFLHHFVQQGTAAGQVSELKGPPTGVTSEFDIPNLQRVPVMFRCVLPQNNESRHALILIRPGINCIQLDNTINAAFNISNLINGTCGKIRGFHPVWAAGHTPPPADVNTFAKTLRVMGEGKNGIMEVDAVPLTCEHCNEMDRDKLDWIPMLGVGIRPFCKRCFPEYYEVDIL